jgi:hypothetical protein
LYQLPILVGFMATTLASGLWYSLFRNGASERNLNLILGTRVTNVRAWFCSEAGGISETTSVCGSDPRLALHYSSLRIITYPHPVIRGSTAIVFRFVQRKQTNELLNLPPELFFFSKVHTTDERERVCVCVVVRFSRELNLGSVPSAQTGTTMIAALA